MPSEASVMPNWQADRYWLRSSCWRAARAAPRRPSRACSSSRPRFARTSANSAATKNPFTSTSTRTATISSAVMGRRPGSRYFEGGRPARWFAAAIVPRAGRRRRSRGDERVDRRREREIGLGDAALAVRGERQAQLVPAVDEDVRVVVRGLGGAGHRGWRAPSRRRSPRASGRGRSRRRPGATGRPRCEPAIWSGESVLMTASLRSLGCAS